MRFSLARRALCIAALFGARLSNASAQSAPCLNPNRDTVTLTGTMRRLTFPGPPNYQDVASGDTAEVGFYLQLRTPICSLSDEVGDAAQNVRLIQLVLQPEQYGLLRDLVNRRITLRGTVFNRHTAHHHAPILLQPVQPFLPRPPGLD